MQRNETPLPAEVILNILSFLTIKEIINLYKNAAPNMFAPPSACYSLTDIFFIDPNPPNPENLDNETLFFKYPQFRKPEYQAFDEKGRTYIFLRTLEQGGDIRDYFKMSRKMMRNITNPTIIDAIKDGRLSFDKARKLTNVAVEQLELEETERYYRGKFQERIFLMTR
jgi:hypothetical protein